jgi:hypothetical protein
MGHRTRCVSARDDAEPLPAAGAPAEESDAASAGASLFQTGKSYLMIFTNVL